MTHKIIHCIINAIVSLDIVDQTTYYDVILDNWLVSRFIIEGADGYIRETDR